MWEFSLFISGVISSSRHLISARRFGLSNGRREARRETRGLKFSICAEHRSSRRPRSGVTTLPQLAANPTIWLGRIGDGARFTMASGAPIPPTSPRICHDGPPCVSLVDECIISIPHLHIYAGSPALSASSPTRVWGCDTQALGAFGSKARFPLPPPLAPSGSPAAPNMICHEASRPLLLVPNRPTGCRSA